MSKLATRLMAALLLAGGATLQIGCQACGSCYDYAPPVTGCQCSSCNCGHGGRSGSRISGLAADQGDSLDKAARIAEAPEPDGGLLQR